MKLLNELILLTESFDIKPNDIKIENGKMLPNQFPNKVKGFDCSNLKNLTSLENCPQEIEQDFTCNWSSITSLEHAPKIIKERFSCTHTKITSLEHTPLKCIWFFCHGNDIKSLKGIGRFYLKECEELWLPDSIKSNILGLCKVNKLEEIIIRDNNGLIVKSGKLYEVMEIVKSHLGTDGEECTEELRQNGLNDYAKF